MPRLPEDFNSLDIRTLYNDKVEWTFKGFTITAKAIIDYDAGSYTDNNTECATSDSMHTLGDRTMSDYRMVADLERGYILRNEMVEVSTRADNNGNGFEFGDIIKSHGKRFFVDGWWGSTENGWHTYKAFEVLEDTYTSPYKDRFYYPASGKNHAGKLTKRIVEYADNEIRQYVKQWEDWEYCGIVITAEKTVSIVGDVPKVEEAGVSLSGIESNSEPRYIRSLVKDLLSDLYAAL